jgi:hypothetical protein
MIFTIGFLLIVCLCLKYVYDQNQNNLDAELIKLYDTNHLMIQEKVKEKSPLLIHNDTKIDMTIQSLIKSNPGYIIVQDNKYISFDSFENDDKKISIYQNVKICKDLLILPHIQRISQLFTDKLNCNHNYSVSLYRDYNRITLSENKHNLLIFKPIQNTTIFYLINPKHKNDIINKDESAIKKWAHKIDLNENQIISIPTNWYYFYETGQKDTILGEYSSDTYFTFLYNSIR